MLKENQPRGPAQADSMMSEQNTVDLGRPLAGGDHLGCRPGEGGQVGELV